MKKKVCVIGLGYIGLPTAIVAAQQGFEVIGFDIDTARVNKINKCDPVIEEPEIVANLQQAINTGNFHASDQISGADYFIIAVPTPFNADKSADLSYVWQAAESIATVLKEGNTVILESTVPVKTTEQLANRLQALTNMKLSNDFYVAHCPERVLPGKIFHELIYNARIIGGVTQESVTAAKNFYKQFVKGPLYLTDAPVAEMVKLIENSSRDVQIAFANQVAAMAYQLGLNPFEVIELANKHPRVSILNPGCGVGGHCIAVDPWFLIKSFPEQTTLLQAARTINDSKPHQIIHSITALAHSWRQKNKDIPTVLLLGLTYKADIDDLRESPALQIAQQLAMNDHINLLICEPHVNKNSIQESIQGAQICDVNSIDKADIIVCLVKHKKFKTINREFLSTKVVLDICGIFYEPQVQEHYYWPAKNMFYQLPINRAEFKEI